MFVASLLSLLSLVSFDSFVSAVTRSQRLPVGGSCPPRQPACLGSTWQGTGAGAQREVKLQGAGGDLRGPGPVCGSCPADRVAVTIRRLRPESRVRLFMI